jgi:hypothetical protein
MPNNRGLPSAARFGMRVAEVRRQIVKSMERPRPEHDTAGARVMRAAFEREAGL